MQARYGFYVVGDQALVALGRPGGEATPGRLRGVRVRPDQRVNMAPYFFDAGLVAYGFLPSRPRDFAGFGVAYGSYSGDLRRRRRFRP